MAAGAFQELGGLSFPNQSTWLAGLAASGPLRRQALRRPVLRGIAGRHLPDRPVQAGQREDPDEPERVHRARQEARREEHGEDVLARLHRGHGLVRRDELRRRLRREDRDDAQGQVGRHARQAGRARRSRRVQALLRRRVSGAARRPTRRIRIRTTSWRRATRRRRTAPAGSPAASATTRARSRSSSCRATPRASRFRASSAAPTSPSRSVPNRTAAAAWISAFTDNASMTALRAKGNIPNTTSLLGTSVNERAARKSWFVPTVEELGQRRERQRPPHDAVADPDREGHRSRTPPSVASDNITFTLNQ